MGIELLAPAGSREALQAAVQNGADAVYLGLQAFGARQYAKNFDVDSLREAAVYCHLRGVQIHVAMNTLIYDKELPQAVELAAEAVRAGADALIIQDLGLAKALREAEIPIPLHASTQMTIHNLDGVQFAQQAGFSRVVLSRELPKQEIETICREIPIETEIFVHGALCMSYSGQCLLSSMIGGRSGNRGRCAQPCRLPYTMLEDDKNIRQGYLMSPKDLCLGAYIPEILSMGIGSLKIEGRMKSAAYVAAVTKVYRDCIDGNRAMTQREEELLQNVFSRDRFTEAFYAGKTGRGMMKTEASNDDIYDKQDAQLMKRLQETYAPGIENRCRNISVEIVLQIGKPLSASAWYEQTKVSCEGQIVQQAKGNPVTHEMVETQLGKLGSSNFILQDLSVELEEQAFVPKSALNAVRRELVEQLEKQIGKRNHEHWTAAYQPPKRRQTVKKDMAITVWTETAAQAAAFADQPVARLYVPADCIQDIEISEQTVVYFPAILRDEAMERAKKQLERCWQRGVRKMASGNVGLLLYAREQGFSLFGTADLNVGNATSAAFWEAFGVEAVEASRELNLRCIEALTYRSKLPIEVTGYGKVALMKIENCLIRVAKDGCLCAEGKQYALQDRKGARMRVTRDGCISTVYNSVPIYMADRLEELQRSGASAVKLVFTEEPPQQCLQIYREFVAGEGVPPQHYTRGHFYRGAQ